MVRIKITKPVDYAAPLNVVAKTPVCVSLHEYIPYVVPLALVPIYVSLTVQHWTVMCLGEASDLYTYNVMVSKMICRDD